MGLSFLCTPALIYLIFMLVHVIIEMFNGNNKGSLLQLIIGTLITLLLQLLCMKGMNLISWIIVFIPFISYTYMMILLYNAFGIRPKENQAKYLVN